MNVNELGEVSRLGQQLCIKIAQLRLVSVAIISGACLGGGLEIALACDYRVAVNKPTTILGFPDLELGLIPMWGGTQRLPKLVGLERGLQMLLGGRRVTPRVAQAWGLIDLIAEEGDPAPAASLNNAGKRTLPFLPLATWRQKLTESTRLGRWLIFRGAARLLRRRLPDDMPAPWEALHTVRAGLQSAIKRNANTREGMEAGLAREREAVLALAQTEAFRNLVGLRRERDKLRTSAHQAISEENHRVHGGGPWTIGVIGGGDRGTALIHMAVTKGLKVVIREANDAALGNALFRMLAILQQEVARGAMAQADLVKSLGNIHGTTAWKGFEDVDLVLEAIKEDPANTKALYRELEKHTAAATPLVTTGPAVRVTELQEGLLHPERVAGLHFLAPVGRSLLAEVVASDKTHADVSQRLADFVAALGRVPWPVKDEPGFLIERLLIPYLNEAILLVKEGMSPTRVDEAMARFGMMQGPLEYLDLMGLDVAAALARALAPVLEDRLVLDETFEFMVRQKWLGQKTGIGFYRYVGRPAWRKKPKPNRSLIARLRAASHAEAPHTMEALSRADQLTWARQRLVLLMINEAAWCLEEKRAQSPKALDLAFMLAGWAPHRGGPLHYARQLGVDTVIGELEDFAADYGPRYEPCPALAMLGELPKTGIADRR
jgi:3-hydroxyacyl-CoA dehydrogenase/enoyl-CoA hydratase/3-hydroxybutyryl-CoA epimerase